MMRTILTTTLLLGLMSCGSSSTENTKAFDTVVTPSTPEPITVSTDSVREFLTVSCASDLYSQNQTSQFEFRNSAIGYKTIENGKPFFVLCGEFRSKKEEQWGEWTPFATIKTSGYEQWLGAHATSYCNDTALVRNMMDISPLIQSKMDSLQKK